MHKHRGRTFTEHAVVDSHPVDFNLSRLHVDSLATDVRSRCVSIG